MSKILVVAEKPSVGRELASILECKTRGNGCLIGETHIVTWAIGHLITLCEPVDYEVKLKTWAFPYLPILPEKIKLKPIESTKAQFEIVANLIQKDEIESLICATDSGREGELIFRYIYVAIGCKKPFQRLWISSMTKSAIKKGFATMKDSSEYDNLYQSARCRSEADWLVGINATRAFTIQNDVLLSVGRVQTPTLALIVEKQKEIDAFDSRPYWELIANYDEFSGTWFDSKNNQTKIYDKEKVTALKKNLSGIQGKVQNVEHEQKSQPPPLLYDLTELQRDSNKKFGYSAKQTLQIAQDLYEKHKLVTYPRTDSRYLSEDMIPTIKNTLKIITVPPYDKFTTEILNMPELPISKRIINDKKISEHHAIIPAETRPNLSRLSKDEKNIYNLIVKRFLCVFYPKYEFSITRIIVNIEQELFSSRGKTIIKLGWMNFYKSEMKSGKDEQTLPDLKANDSLNVNSLKILSKKTKPPKQYTEASLLSAMENAGRFVENEELKEQLKENGLGTPATRASIIERLIQVKYIERKGKTLSPTQKGQKLIAIIPAGLKSPEFTGKWEKGLSQISKGEVDSERFMKGIIKYVKKIVDEAKNMKGKVQFERDKNRKQIELKDTLGRCPNCGNGFILENQKAYYCSDWKKGCKFTVWKNSLERYKIELTPNLIKMLLENRKCENIEALFGDSDLLQKAKIILQSSGRITIIKIHD